MRGTYPITVHRARLGQRDGRERGQAIVLFALFLVVLLGTGGLVLDVARVYSLQRYERSVADAAALAGAQDLQDNPNTTNASPADYPRARSDALQLLVNELGGSGVPVGSGTTSWGATYNCDPGLSGTGTDIVNCPIPGTSYAVSIKTPSPSWVDTDPYHAVQVTVFQPRVSMTFTRLFGQSTWNVGETSVAGIDHTSRWAVETLRPPLPKGPNDVNYNDLSSGGTNTALTVFNGDIGSNTTAYTNSGGTITLKDASGNVSNGFYIWHFDPVIDWNQTGTPPLPTGRLLPKLLPDPQYTIPTRPTIAGTADSTCANAPDVPKTGTWTCLTPGLYPTNLHYNSSTNVYLEPGLYYFSGGLQVDGQLVGGNTGAASGGTCNATTWSGCTGVTLVFPANAYFKSNNATLIALNGGPPAPPNHPYGDCAINASDCPTAPEMITLGTGKQKFVVPLTIAVDYVNGDSSTCFNGTTPLNACSSSSVLQLPGNGNLDLGGVTYAPTDNVQIRGNGTSSSGLAGQLIVWTVAYSGGAQVNQYYPGSVGSGVLHLDIACSGINTPCSP